MVKKATAIQTEKAKNLGDTFINFAKTTFPESFHGDEHEVAELQENLREIARDIMFRSVPDLEE